MLTVLMGFFMKKLRLDVKGFFWDETPIEKISSQKKQHREIPDFIWENDLPYFNEALNFEWSEIKLEDIEQGDKFVYDMEVYPNYTLVAFKQLKNGKYFHFHQSNTIELQHKEEVAELFDKIIECGVLIGFNNHKYDNVILNAFYQEEWNCEKLKQLSDMIIEFNLQPYQVSIEYNLSKFNVNSIDLYGILKFGALKTCGLRLHSKKIQELPYDPSTILTEDQMIVVWYYCLNDLQITEDLYYKILPAIELREKISIEYKFDARSKAKSTLAEDIFKTYYPNIYKGQPVVNYNYKVNVSNLINFKTEYLNDFYNFILSQEFFVNEHGKSMNDNIYNSLEIGDKKFTFAKGGLHSNDRSLSYYSNNDMMILDADVSSFYPLIVLNDGLYPKILGLRFLEIYADIVKNRLKAKKEGDKLYAEVYKIVLNGIYGKFSQKSSVFFEPSHGTHVTLTGQLSLLMLIEKLTLNDIKIISANTDGITVYFNRKEEQKVKSIFKEWEQELHCELEIVNYKSIHMRDCNDYIGVYNDNTTKTKGVYLTEKDQKEPLTKNPFAEIVSLSMIEYIINKTSLRETINNCTDITKFICTKTSKQGVCCVGKEYLGKYLRWYYGKEDQIIQVIKNGAKVGKSDFAKSCAILPDHIPDDLNYDIYYQEAVDNLKLIGVAYYDYS